MRRPRVWIRVFLLVCLLLVLGEYVALTRLAPHFLIQAVQRMAGGELVAGRARLSFFPLTTTLSSLRLVANTPQSALSIQGMVIRPRWLSFPSRVLWVDSVKIDRPMLRLTRTQAGTLLWPSLPEAVTAGASPSKHTSPPWQIHVDSLEVVDGVIELVDEKPATPFHGIVDHLSFLAGPVTIPLSGSQQMSFAVHSELVGDGGHAAPFYCSGMLDLTTKDLQAFCRLEPLALAAFEPYYGGSPEVRVYATTLASVSQWSAKANELHSRIQWELGGLTEGDLSIRGRTIFNVKKIANPNPRLSGEISLTGPLNDPHRWRAELLPGDDQVQQLVKRMLYRGIEMIKIGLWGTQLRIALTPASKATMATIEAVAKEIKEALEIIAIPGPEEAAGITPQPAAAPQAGEAGSTPPTAGGPASPAPPSTQAPTLPPPQDSPAAQPTGPK